MYFSSRGFTVRTSSWRRNISSRQKKKFFALLGGWRILISQKPAEVGNYMCLPSWFIQT